MPHHIFNYLHDVHLHTQTIYAGGKVRKQSERQQLKALGKLGRYSKN